MLRLIACLTLLAANAGAYAAEPSPFPLPEPSPEPSTAPAATPEPTPLPRRPARPAGRNGGYSFIDLEATFSNIDLSATNPATGDHLSLHADLAFDTMIGWTQVWNRKFQTFVRLTFSQIHFDSDATLTHDTDFYRRVIAGFELLLAPTSTLVTSLGPGEEPYVRPSGPGTYAVDGIYVTRLTGALRQAVFHSRTLAVGVEPELAILLPTSTPFDTIHAGLSYRGKLYAAYNPLSLPLRLYGSLFAGQTLQDQSAFDQTRTDLGAQLQLGLSFDK